MKTYGGVELQLKAFLTLGLNGDEWSVSHPSHLNPGKRASRTHWIGGWVGPRTGLDVVTVLNTICTLHNINMIH
jgi:hypothetical protein